MSKGDCVSVSAMGKRAPGPLLQHVDALQDHAHHGARPPVRGRDAAHLVDGVEPHVRVRRLALPPEVLAAEGVRVHPRAEPRLHVRKLVRPRRREPRLHVAQVVVPDPLDGVALAPQVVRRAAGRQASSARPTRTSRRGGGVPRAAAGRDPKAVQDPLPRPPGHSPRSAQAPARPGGSARRASAMRAPISSSEFSGHAGSAMAVTAPVRGSRSTGP